MVTRVETRRPSLRGIFSYLSLSLLYGLHQERRVETHSKAFPPEHDMNDTDINDDNQCFGDDAANLERKMQGVWSTATGPISLSLRVCKCVIRKGTMMEVSPAFSFQVKSIKIEGSVRSRVLAMHINHNICGLAVSFTIAIKRLRSDAVSRVCARWYEDYSQDRTCGDQ